MLREELITHPDYLVLRPPAGTIDRIPQKRVREAMFACLPANGRIDRRLLQRLAAHRLGFSKLGMHVRARLTRAIGTKKHAGRFDTDWVEV